MIGSCVWIGREAVLRILHHEHLELKLVGMAFSSCCCCPLRWTSVAVAWPASRSEAAQQRCAGSRCACTSARTSGRRPRCWWDCWRRLRERGSICQRLEYADPVAALVVAADHSARDVGAGATDDGFAAGCDAAGDACADRQMIWCSELTGVRRRAWRGADACAAFRSDTFVDLTLQLPRNLTFQRQRADYVCGDGSRAERLPGADVVIHTVPTATLGESVFDRIRAVAARSNLAIHDVSVQQYDGGLHVEQHLEVPETMSLREAHEIATLLETAMRAEIPRHCDAADAH
jgi:hypothetical protein